jgi:hypothetical protein
MSTTVEELRVPLDGGFGMQLRADELESVAAGLRELDPAFHGSSVTLAAAVRALPLNDRASLWELAVRRYGRRKPLEQAAGEIGMDTQRGQALLEAFSKALTS